MLWRRILPSVLMTIAALALPATAQLELDERVSLRLEDRLRVEMVDWFAPDASGDPEQYVFVANRLRFTATYNAPRVQIVVQGQDARIGNLPNDAVVAPVGPLGTGGAYYANTRSTWQGETVLHQAFAQVRAKGAALTFGRFEYLDGAETVPGNPTLATLKKTRISERLIGPFNFTHVGRSFDGAKLSWGRGPWNLSAVGARPTRGGFEVSANRQLDGMAIASGSATYTGMLAEIPADLRFFYLYFDDRRGEAIKVDNRPSAERAEDDAQLAIHSVGGHGLFEVEAGPGFIDGLVWVTFQTGDWGSLDHRAWAYAIEAGYQLARVPGRPWLRVGYNASSGDDDGDDGTHRTFLTPLPTPRKFARMPYFNGMNARDLFAMLLLHPHSSATVRLDYHWLQLSEKDDLWYAGGGATNQTSFGFSGLPSGGQDDLGHLIDISLDYRWSKHLGFGAYIGRAFGGSVVSGNFSGRNATYGFVELRMAI